MFDRSHEKIKLIEDVRVTYRGQIKNMIHKLKEQAQTLHNILHDKMKPQQTTPNKEIHQLKEQAQAPHSILHDKMKPQRASTSKRDSSK